MSISPEIQGFVRSEIQSVLLDKEKLTYRVHNLEHLLQDFIDFVEKPQIAGDGFSRGLFRGSLQARTNSIRGLNDDSTGISTTDH